MFVKTKHILFLIGLTLTGCSTSQMVATSDNRLLAPTSSMVSFTSTPDPVCTEEPDPKPSKVALVELSSLPIELESGTDWFLPQTKDGLEFYISGIYAIDNDIAFIFGGLRVPAATVRSLLLRSSDGGNSWKEVMTPVNIHDITHMVFLDNGEGWTVATRTLEDASGTRLWHTTDYGETWQQIEQYHLPANGIMGIRSFDNSHLQIRTLFWVVNPKTDRYAIFDSYDGGITWQESFSVPLEQNNYYAVIEAYSDTPGGHYGGYYQCTSLREACDAYGQDGSKWQIENIYGNECLNGYSFDKLVYAEVRHFWREHETRLAIPLFFSYEGNKIQVKP